MEHHHHLNNPYPCQDRPGGGCANEAKGLRRPFGLLGGTGAMSDRVGHSFDAWALRRPLGRLGGTGAMSDRVGCSLKLLGGHLAKNALQAVLHSLSLGELALHTGAASDVARASRRHYGLGGGTGMHGDRGGSADVARARASRRHHGLGGGTGMYGDRGGRADEARASRRPLALLGPQVRRWESSVQSRFATH
jgi:hypothetical protein